MIFELREYESTPARVGELHARFRDHVLSFFRKHGITPVAFWTEVDRPHVVVYLVCFDDERARDPAWASLREDPSWRRLLECTDPDGDLIVQRTRKLLVETDYSPSVLRHGILEGSVDHRGVGVDCVEERETGGEDREGVTKTRSGE
jgi:hypothetical protein